MPHSKSKPTQSHLQHILSEPLEPAGEESHIHHGLAGPSKPAKKKKKRVVDEEAEAEAEGEGYLGGVGLEEVLEDLSSRFILMLPDEELQTTERIAFQIEEAHWFYEDFIRPHSPSLPSLSLRTFSQLFFQHTYFPAALSSTKDPSFGPEEFISGRAYDRFIRFKKRVPVCGCILINKTWDKCILVKGWKSTASWGFPKGKINKDEETWACAAREVHEETGYNPLPLLQPSEYIEITMHDQRITLFIVAGVDEGYAFQTLTRKEISAIEWFKFADLPTWKRSKPSSAAMASGKGKGAKFYMLAPFVGPLKNWVKTHRPANYKQLAEASAAAYPETTPSQVLEHPEPPSEAHDPQSATPSRMAYPTSMDELFKLFKISSEGKGNATPEIQSAVPVATPPSTSTDKGSRSELGQDPSLKEKENLMKSLLKSMQTPVLDEAKTAPPPPPTLDAGSQLLQQMLAQVSNPPPPPPPLQAPPPPQPAFPALPIPDGFAAHRQPPAPLSQPSQSSSGLDEKERKQKALLDGLLGGIMAAGPPPPPPPSGLSQGYRGGPQPSLQVYYSSGPPQPQMPPHPVYVPPPPHNHGFPPFPPPQFQLATPPRQPFPPQLRANIPGSQTTYAAPSPTYPSHHVPDFLAQQAQLQNAHTQPPGTQSVLEPWLAEQQALARQQQAQAQEAKGQAMRLAELQRRVDVEAGRTLGHVAGGQVISPGAGHRAELLGILGRRSSVVPESPTKVVGGGRAEDLMMRLQAGGGGGSAGGPEGSGIAPRADLLSILRGQV